MQGLRVQGGARLGCVCFVSHALLCPWAPGSFFSRKAETQPGDANFCFHFGPERTPNLCPTPIQQKRQIPLKLIRF